MSEAEKVIIKNIIETAEHNLDEEVNGFKKVDRNLLKDWAMEVNAILKKIIWKYYGNRQINQSMCHLCWKKGGSQTKPKRGNAVKEPWWKRRTEKY